MATQLTPGTCVKFKGNPLGYRYLLAVVVQHEPGGGVVLQTEGSDCARVARHEIQVVKNSPYQPLRFLRHRLPYGKWTCADGREVLFNRDYKPIWQRRPGHAAEPADRQEWVPFERQEWYYQDGQQPWRNADAEKRSNRVLESWGLPCV